MPENCVCSFQAFSMSGNLTSVYVFITAGVSMLPVLLCVCSDRGCVSCSIVCQPVRVRSAPIACLTDAEGQQPSEASKAVHFRVCPPGFPRRQTWAKGYPLRVFTLKNRKNDHPLLIGGLRIHIQNASKALFYRMLSVSLSCRGCMTFATKKHISVLSAHVSNVGGQP